MDEASTGGAPRYQTLFGAASLLVGPLLMAVGWLVHPRDTADFGELAAIITAGKTRWSVAHTLLFLGIVLLVPGLLSLTDLAAARGPRTAYAARVLLLIGVPGAAAVFLGEMVAGRIGSTRVTSNLLDTLFSGPVIGPLTAVMAAFFVGVVLLAGPLLAEPGPLRRPAAAFLVGALLVLAEIVSSEIRLSQVGGVLMWVGAAGFARLLVRGEVGAPEGTRAGHAVPTR